AGEGLSHAPGESQLTDGSKQCDSENAYDWICLSGQPAPVMSGVAHPDGQRHWFRHAKTTLPMRSYIPRAPISCLYNRHTDATPERYRWQPSCYSASAPYTSTKRLAEYPGASEQAARNPPAHRAYLAARRARSSPQAPDNPAAGNRIAACLPATAQRLRTRASIAGLPQPGRYP